MKRTITILAIALALAGCKEQGTTAGPPMPVIFETDMGNDIDDALALDMLYKYMDAGRVELLAITSNKDSDYSPEFIDIMNTWYGYPDIPIGRIDNGVTIDDYVNYAEDVCRLEVDGEPMFRRTLDRYDTLEDAHMLYRRILAARPDNSVTVISVGFSTNLARLLETQADGFSPLTGTELVARKVRSLHVMGGSFGEKARAEFNIVHDIPSAQKVFAGWPGEIILSPFELGAGIRFPASVIENEFDRDVANPLVEAYYHYRPMPYDRPTWDLTSVLYAVEPDAMLMDLSGPGRIVVDDDGYTDFIPGDGGRHFVLSTDKERSGQIRERFIGLITTRPNNLQYK